LTKRRKFYENVVSEEEIAASRAGAKGRREG